MPHFYVNVPCFLYYIICINLFHQSKWKTAFIDTPLADPNNTYIDHLISCSVLPSYTSQHSMFLAVCT